MKSIKWDALMVLGRGTMPLHNENTKVRMCANCAGAFEYRPDDHERVPDTHQEAGESCPTMYR